MPQPPAHFSAKDEPVDHAVRYIIVVAATILFAGLGFVALLFGLDAVGRKPPPSFTNSYCIDAKLAAFREHPPVKPTHLIVGSSVPWRNISAETLALQNFDARPLNVGLCGLSMNQSAFAGRFFLERFPSVTDVLLVLDPFDMQACRPRKNAIFDAADVSAYLSGESDLQYYFKYFDVVSLIINAIQTPEPLTSFGDGPLVRGWSAGLVYGPASAPQSECERPLALFAEEVQRQGKHLVVATMPLLGSWSQKYDATSLTRHQLAESIRRSLDGTSATFWDGWSEITLPPHDYFDALHLHWRAVPDFTRQLVRATGFGSSGTIVRPLRSRARRQHLKQSSTF